MIYNSYQIADIIGVNVSTIKRWTDTGKLGCQQTPGGHRKFHLNDLTDFIKNNKKFKESIKIEYLIGNNKNLIDSINNLDTTYLSNYVYKKLISGNKENFISICNSLILKGNPLHLIFDKILIPVLIKIGDNWDNNKLSITEEHLASETIRQFLYSLNFQQIQKKSKYNAFCFTMVNDKHDLPIHMAESLLCLKEKIKIFNLGPNLPANDFIELSKKIFPDIIYISVIYVDNKDLLNKEIASLFNHFRELDTKIFLSGTGLNKLNLNGFNFFKLNSFESFNSELELLFK